MKPWELDDVRRAVKGKWMMREAFAQLDLKMGGFAPIAGR